MSLKNFSYCLTFIFFMTLIACGQDSSQKVLKFKGKSISFDQVGYYKGKNKLRYFTFYINTQESIDRKNIPEELLKLVKDHGSKQMNTAGNVTASFYYIDKNKTPDITTLTAKRANDVAHEMKPIIAVWKMPNGQINLLKNPE